MRRPPAAALAAALLLAAPPLVEAAAPRVHALTGARIVVAPGVEIEQGTVVLRDGVIEAVGAEVEPPPDARVWELEGLTLYPGLIESYAPRSWPAAGDQAPRPQAGHPNSRVHPEREMLRHAADEAADQKLRGAGFTTAAVVPRDGQFRGRGAVVGLGDGEVGRRVIRPRWGHHVAVGSGSSDGYPTSLMGAVALFRQTMLDAAWHRDAWNRYRRSPAQERPRYDSALETLAEAASGGELVVFETADVLDTLRVVGLVDELGLEAMVVGNGQESRWLERVAEAGLPHLLPLDYPDAPGVGEEDDFSVSLEDLRHWDEAPDNPARLIAAGVEVAFTSHRLDDPKKMYVALHRSLERDLSPDDALAALTTVPAALLGIGRQTGSIEVGKLGNLVVVDGDLLVEKPKIREVWIDGDRYELKETQPPEVEPAGTWEVTVRTPDGQQIPAGLVLEGKAPSLTGELVAGEVRIPLESVEVSGSTVEITFDGTRIGQPGTIELQMTIEGEQATGSGRSPGGPFTVKATRVQKPVREVRS